MPLSVGFTGTREGLSDHQRSQLVVWFMRHKPDDFHHGDCIGADDTSHAIAVLTLPLIGVDLHPCNIPSMRAYAHMKLEPYSYFIHPEKPPLVRNKDIVVGRDFLLACPSGPEVVRSGTWSTVRYARKTGVPVVLFWPGGRVEGQEQYDPV